MNNTPHVPMDDSHLVNYAANAGRSLEPRGQVPVRGLAKGLRRDLRAIERACQKLSGWSGEEGPLPPGGEWLLDNHYLAVREGQQALQVFRREGRKTLRGTGREESLLEGCVRGALWAVPNLDSGRLERYLEGFQQTRPLTEGELSLLVSALAAGLVGNLARLCEEIGRASCRERV